MGAVWEVVDEEAWGGRGGRGGRDELEGGVVGGGGGGQGREERMEGGKYSQRRLD